jgi:DNA invertase Pin-like site-specific DNA recombinase
MKTTAIYLRVSTADQTTEHQRRELHEYCERRGWGNVAEYADVVSGSKFSREGLDRLMSDIRRLRVERVVCVKLDRLGRSLPHLAQLIAELDTHGVAVVCTSQAIDTSHDNPAGRLQMHVLMAVAEFERSLIRERTKAGLATALANGKQLGRPVLHLNEEQSQILRDHRSNPTNVRDLATRLGVSVGTAHKLIKAA